MKNINEKVNKKILLKNKAEKTESAFICVSRHVT